MTPKLAVVLLVGLLALAFGAGRWSVPGCGSTCRDSLAVLRADVQRARARADQLARDIELAELATVNADTAEARARREAAAFTRTVRAHQDTADRARVVLATAPTCADSVAALLQETRARRSECAARALVNDSLTAALAHADTARAGVARQVTALRELVETDSVTVRRALDQLARQERAVRGCRLLGVPCPTALAGYDTRRAGFFGGVGLPLRRWLTVAVVVPF